MTQNDPKLATNLPNKRAKALGYDAAYIATEIQMTMSEVGRLVGKNIDNHLQQEEILRNDSMAYRRICDVEKLVAQLLSLKEEK